MKRSILLLSIGMTSLISACSFQKDPNKEPVTKVIAVEKEVKVGMTKEELLKELSKNENASLPDRILFVLKNDEEDVATALKLVMEAEKSEIDVYGSDGLTALDFALKYEIHELAVLLLERGASPYRYRKGSFTRVIDAYRGKITEYSNANIQSLMDAATKRIYQSGLAAIEYGRTGELLDFAIGTGFPLTLQEEGMESLLSVWGKRIGTSSFVLKSPDDAADCRYGIQELLSFVEKAEGAEKINWKIFYEASLGLHDIELGHFVLQRLSGSEGSYVAFLRQAEQRGIDSILEIRRVFGQDKVSTRAVEESLMSYIRSAAASVLVNELFDSYISKSLYNDFPEAYEALYLKVGDLKPNKTTSMEMTEDGLPRGRSDGGPPRSIYQMYVDGEQIKGRCYNYF